MRLFIYSLIASVALFAGIVLATRTAPENKTVELFITKTVQGDDGPQDAHYVCSGGFIAPNGLILTAKHCTEGASHLTVLTLDQQHYEATLVRVSDNQDLALIKIARTGVPFFTLATGVGRGDVISTIGNPLAIPVAQFWGKVAKADGDLLFTDMTVLPGNSGGVVFNKDGELIGIEVAVCVVGFGISGLSISESLSAVREFLSEAR